MDLLNKTKEICQLHQIYPSRSKGQNFLTNETVYDGIVEAGELSKEDLVLEVGPGLGFLTSRLAKKAKHVLAVELDDKLADYLSHTLMAEGVENVEVVNSDILKLNLSNPKYQIQNSKYKIIANLPYNITSFFLRMMISGPIKPSLLVLLLQKEVARRICAKPGDMSLLALSIQFYAEPEVLFDVPSKDFYPSPEVQSAVIRIKVREKGRESVDEKAFFRLAKIGFSAKRKMLKNNLAGGLAKDPAEIEKILVSLGLNAKIRAEDLAVEDWIRLVSSI
jgi:16S rRNA (adenine1518-N6/adenine1519-N6)-dimethyltransferase